MSDQRLGLTVRKPENLNRAKDNTAQAGAEPPGVFPGSRLFQLRATHGLPIGDALPRIIGAGLSVGWISFITEARANEWYDFQSLEVIEQSWLDAGLDSEQLKQILLRLKLWIMDNPIVG